MKLQNHSGQFSELYVCARCGAMVHRQPQHRSGERELGVGSQPRAPTAEAIVARVELPVLSWRDIVVSSLDASQGMSSKP